MLSVTLAGEVWASFLEAVMGAASSGTWHFAPDIGSVLWLTT